MVAELLAEHDFRVTAIASGRELLATLDGVPADAVLLDLRLPGEDGMVIARRLRERSAIPIIILSARADEADRVMGLELAADDYVTKPFSPRELVARLRAVLRRAQAVAAEGGSGESVRAYRFAGWELDMRQRRLRSPAGVEVELTNTEFSLLCAFLQAPGQVLSRDQLLERSRLHSLEVCDRSIDVTILRLRRKIERSPSDPKLIRTERGAGYRFAEPVAVLR